MESGNDLEYEQEFYEITHHENIISFNQLNNGSFDNIYNKNLGLIKITGTRDVVNFGCVLKNDYVTI